MSAENLNDLVSYFQQAHDIYLEVYEKALAQYRMEDPNCTAEIGFKIPEPNLLIESFGRVDLVMKIGEKTEFVEIQIDNIKLAKEALFELEGIEIVLFPIVWNGIYFHCENFDFRNSNFIEWLDKWLDIEDKSYLKNKDFQNVIHRVAVEQNSEFIVSIDFGSAPIDSLLEFISVLKAVGNQSVRLDSAWNELGSEKYHRQK